MLMRWTEGVETDDVDSFAFASVGRILGYILAERAWSLEDRPETSETDQYPVTILDSARDEFAPRSGRILAHASSSRPYVWVSEGDPRARDCTLRSTLEPPNRQPHVGRVNDNDFIKQ